MVSILDLPKEIVNYIILVGKLDSMDASYMRATCRKLQITIKDGDAKLYRNTELKHRFVIAAIKDHSRLGLLFVNSCDVESLQLGLSYAADHNHNKFFRRTTKARYQTVHPNLLLIISCRAQNIRLANWCISYGAFDINYAFINAHRYRGGIWSDEMLFWFIEQGLDREVIDTHWPELI